MRARRTGAAPALVAAGGAAGVYWLAQASIDWFWSYTAVTALAFALMGMACAAGFTGEVATRAGRSRMRTVAVVTGAVAAVLMSAAAFSAYLGSRLTDSAYESWGADPAGAYRNLDRAAALNPLDDEPFVAAGAIAQRLGQERKAAASFQEALERKPEAWATHYRLAQVLRRRRPDAARRELAEARRLNPGLRGSLQPATVRSRK